MASAYTLRSRRSAAQLHAVEQVEREILATDPYSGCKYLQDFTEAFQKYQTVISPHALQAKAFASDVVLVGDYHALPASQQYAAQIVRQLARMGRKVVLGVEFVFSRDQQLLDDWQAGRIDGDELRERLRFEVEWGYGWHPFLELLQAGRECADAIYGLDCTPRNTLRRLLLRDRHAASGIARMRELHPEAVAVVLFGESHLAPNHLPKLLAKLRPADHILTVLQNVDSLYWKAVGEPCERVDAVQVQEDVLCVFNSSPLEKYESYRLCIERWKKERPSVPDLAPAFYNMISALLRFLKIDEYSVTTGAHARFLVDRLPDVQFGIPSGQIQRILKKENLRRDEVRSFLARVKEGGICYVPGMNTVFLREFSLMSGGEEAARFVHHSCRAGLRQAECQVLDANDHFYNRVLEEALAYFGSRALFPARPPIREGDLYALYASASDSMRQIGLGSSREYMQLIDFLVLHKSYEANCRKHTEAQESINEAILWTGKRFKFVTEWLGRLLGSQIYDAYLTGDMDKRSIRSLYLRNLSKRGSSRAAYFAAARKSRRSRKRA